MFAHNYKVGYNPVAPQNEINHKIKLIDLDDGEMEWNIFDGDTWLRFINENNLKYIDFGDGTWWNMLDNMNIWISE